MLTAALAYHRKEYKEELGKYYSTRKSILASNFNKDTENGRAKSISTTAPTSKSKSKQTSNEHSSVNLDDVSIHNTLPVSRIFYCSRTHSQLQQVVDELRNSADVNVVHLNSTILASRTHLCVNERVKKLCVKNKTSIDIECREASLTQSCSYSFKSELVLPSLSSKKSSLAAPSSFFSAKEGHGCDTGSSSCASGGNRVADLTVEECVENHTVSSAVWDIEDIVSAGSKVKGCPYYASREGLQGTRTVPKSDIVLAPYNYLLSPFIRDSLKIDLSNTILIFDEAHNIEDIARGEMSIDITVEQLIAGVGQLKAITGHETGNLPHFKAFHQLLGDLLEWVTTKRTEIREGKGYDGDDSNCNTSASNLSNSNGKKYASGHVWNGSAGLEILKTRCLLDKDTLPVYEAHFIKIQSENEEMQMNLTVDALLAKENEDTGIGVVTSVSDALPRSKMHLSYEEGELEEHHDSTEPPLQPLEVFQLSTATLKVIEGILSLVKHMLLENNRYADDFKMVLQLGNSSYNSKFDNRDTKLGFWCLNPAVCFHSIKQKCRSVILTSGTLSPMSSFASELDMSFPVRLEAAHVIDVSKQVYASAVANYAGTPLSAVYANQQNPSYQHALGNLLRVVVRMTRGGVLIFFPSYSMMNKFHVAWEDMGILDAIEGEGNGVEIYMEPNGKVLQSPSQHRKRYRYKGNQDSKPQQLDEILSSYYECVDNGKKAVLLAVCRGKVSEGINFSDCYARAVLVVGIPFPNTQDLGVQLKKNYQDEKLSRRITLRNEDGNSCLMAMATSTSTSSISGGNSGKGDSVLSGNDWYKLQAFRAINQAVGRCIRHKTDFGAIFLCDPRYSQFHTQQSLSRWLRNSVSTVENFEDQLLSYKLYCDAHEELHPFTKSKNIQELESVVNGKRGLVATGSGVAVGASKLQKKNSMIINKPFKVPSKVQSKSKVQTPGKAGTENVSGSASYSIKAAFGRIKSTSASEPLRSEGEVKMRIHSEEDSKAKTLIHNEEVVRDQLCQAPDANMCSAKSLYKLESNMVSNSGCENGNGILSIAVERGSGSSSFMLSSNDLNAASNRENAVGTQGNCLSRYLSQTPNFIDEYPDTEEELESDEDVE